MDNAKQFSDKFLHPRILEDYRSERYDRAIIQQMGENGFLGCTLTQYGGAGLSHTGYGLINREI